MPYDVEMPDGTVIEDVPDHLTQADLMRVIEGGPVPLSQQQVDQAALEAAPWYQQAYQGVQEGMQELVQPVLEAAYPESITANIFPEDRLERSQAVDTLAKTGGEIGLDVAALAVPATRIAKAANTVRTALAGESALVAGYEGLQEPAEGESRLGNAAIGAAGTAAGYGIGSALGKTLGPLREGAQELMDRGVRLSPGQARPRLEGVERAMSYIPGLAGATQKRQAQALDDWNRLVLDEVDPTLLADPEMKRLFAGVTGKEIGPEAGEAGFKSVQDAYGKAYERVWADVTNIQDVNLWNMGFGLQRLAAELDDVPSDFRGLARRTHQQVNDQMAHFARTGNVAALERADDIMRTAGARVDGPANDWFDSLREVYRNALPTGTKKNLSEVDSHYRKYIVAQRAGSYKDALAKKAKFTPSQLLGAVKAKNSERALVKGEGALQDVAALGEEVIGDMIPQGGIQAAAAGSSFPTAVGLGVLSPPLAAAGIAGRTAMMGPMGRALLTGGPAPELGKFRSALLRGTQGAGRALGSGPAMGVAGGVTASHSDWMEEMRQRSLANALRLSNR